MSDLTKLTLKIVNLADECAKIQAIRTQVFQVEQGVDPALDFDGLDESATHILALWGDLPIGTARIRYLSPTLAKIERVAVLSTHRGLGIGAAIMQEAIAFLRLKNIPEIKVNSQLQANVFYQKLGFISYGEPFSEAGIPHIEMRRQTHDD